MLAKVHAVDFFYVQDSHQKIHERLENWARYICDRRPSWMAPMWKQGRSNGRQWHTPVIQVPVNTLDGHVMEKAVAALPIQHREAIRWQYVWQTNPSRPRKQLGVTDEGLIMLVTDGRRMLINRGV